MRHPGNALLRSVVQTKLKEYAAAESKKGTTDVTWAVVRILKGEFGARFLKEENIENNGLGWVEVSNEAARQKVRIAFRDLRAKISKTSAQADAETTSTSEPKTSENNGTNNEVGKTKRKVDSPLTTRTASPDASLFACVSSSEATPYKFPGGDSSVSVFLGMDGTSKKRQRCSGFCSFIELQVSR